MFFNKSKITFHCKLPEVLERYPILPAKSVKFNWVKQSSINYKKIVEERGTYESIAGTVKCPGLHSIMQKGWILTSWFDLTIRTYENEKDRFDYIVPTSIGSYLQEYNYNQKLINWFSASEVALRVPVPDNSLQTLVKISTPWTVDIPKGMSLLMMPIPYPDNPNFSAVHGILESGDFYDINAIIQIHKTPGELFIPAGTPLCQLLVVPDNKEEIIQKMQDNKNWKAELKNKFKNVHRFITKNS
jgi:hypothetical protein